MWKIDYKKIRNINTEYINELGFIKKNGDKNKKYNTLQTKWENLRTKYFTNNSLYNFTIEELLTFDFNKLVDIFLEYTKSKVKFDKQILNSETKKIEIINTMDNDFSLVFNYSNYDDKIANFFKRYRKEIGISSCFYCDTAYINTLSTNSKGFENENEYETWKRMFDLDHFFPKAQCPILSLSLKNFIPSCKICNSTIKGSTPFFNLYRLSKSSNLKKEIEQLSPTSNKYSYTDNIVITVVPPFIRNNTQDYHLEFINTSNNPIYDKITKAFMLEQRYNYSNIKDIALNLLDIKTKYNDSYIKMISNTLSKNGLIISEDQIKEDLFHIKFDEKNGTILRKLKKDIIT